MEAAIAASTSAAARRVVRVGVIGRSGVYCANKSSLRSISQRARRCTIRFTSRHSGREVRIDSERSFEQRIELGAILALHRHRLGESDERPGKLSVRQRDRPVEMQP
jgi:predicted component of type VI protein secretion system